MKTLLVTAGIMTNQGKVLIAQRKEGAARGLLWEFPGGKLREGEEPKEALQRELREELGIEVKVGTILEVVFHVYPEYPILLLAYRCRIEKGRPQPLGCREVRWVPIRELAKLPMAQADVPIRDALCISEGGA
ncbi:MAG: (deoxy)nucleoside triphosphate pyrophosphohydrolase [Desulfobacterales bacterium]|nr:(deoxy)nucleoside triphosphate pyrophosphohydrolase [Desulfobacterales bacterium]